MDSPQLYAPALLEVARERNVPSQLFQASAVTWLEYLDLCAELVETTGDPHIGLDIGSRMSLASHGLLGHATLSCRTVAESLELLTKYRPFRRQGARAQLAFTQEMIALAFWPPTKVAGAPSFFVDMFFSAVARANYELTGHRMGGVVLELSIPTPRICDPRYAELITADVKFSCPSNRLLGPRSEYEGTLPGAKIPAASIHKKICEDLLRKSALGGSVAELAKSHLIVCSAPFPSVGETAIALGFSERTFRRRLADERTNFQGVLDDVRNFLATEYLTGTDISVEAIALALGYSDHTNFRRAFVRWNNVTPGAFRRTFSSRG